MVKRRRQGAAPFSQNNNTSPLSKLFSPAALAGVVEHLDGVDCRARRDADNAGAGVGGRDLSGARGGEEGRKERAGVSVARTTQRHMKKKN